MASAKLVKRHASTDSLFAMRMALDGTVDHLHPQPACVGFLRTDVRLCAARLATRGLRRGAAASESAAPCKMCYLFARCGAAPSQFKCIVFCSCFVCTFAAGWFVSSFVALNRRRSIGLARFALPYSCQRLRELSCLLFSTLCLAAADPVLCPTSQNHYDLGRSVRCGQRMPTLAVSTPDIPYQTSCAGFEQEVALCRCVLVLSPFF